MIKERYDRTELEIIKFVTDSDYLVVTSVEPEDNELPIRP